MDEWNDSKGPTRLNPFELHAYLCPRCKADLTADREGLVCTRGERFALINGIPRFLKSFAETEARYDELNALAKEHGWRRALDLANSADADTIRYVTEESRARFIELLPITPNSVLLEVGASLGQMTVPLAERSKHVFALEVVPGQAEFAATRAGQERLQNVSVACGGDDCLLPYADQFFDVVVLNLVLEWCSQETDLRRVRMGQNLLLKECSRVLRAGGSFFVATKNRYSIRSLVGYPDEHASDMPFGNALPRWLMALALKVRGKPSASGLLYSYGELSRALRASGLSSAEGYWAVPHPRFPDEYVALDHRLAPARRRLRRDQTANRSTRLLAALPGWLLPHLMPGLVFVGHK
jgi:SAM-dependent methyltransferase